MGVLDEVVLGLGAAGVAAQPAALAEGGELFATAGEELVDVGLVAGVEDEPVAGALEDAVERHGELDNAEVDAEVSTGPGDRVDEELPDLAAQPVDVGGAETAQVLGPGDLFEEHGGDSTGCVLTDRLWDRGEPASPRA